MRVGLVCPYDLSVPGGVQTQVTGLARSLDRLGLDVMVIAAGRSPSGRHPPRARTSRPCEKQAAFVPVAADGDQPYMLVPAGRSMRLPANNSMAPVAPTPTAMARTVRALRRFRPDVVHVHEPLVPGPSLAAMIAGPRPIVATFHRSGADSIYAVESRLIGAVMARADVAVAVSQAAASTAREVLGRHVGPEQLLIVPNGVALDIYTSALEEAAAGAKPRQQPTIVFVGRHEERKGLRVLLEAFAELPANVHLDVLGDGPLSAVLRSEFAHPRISWLGTVSDEDKARYLASSDLFVAPSTEGESFGVVLLEAMAAGTAVVASDLPGYRLAAAEAARFVVPGDRSALARAITALLADAAERQRLAAAGREVAKAHSMDVTARRYEELYGSVGSEGVSQRR